MYCFVLVSVSVRFYVEIKFVYHLSLAIKIDIDDLTYIC